jgi:hypothetical protein
MTDASLAERLLPVTEVAERTSFSRAHIYEMVKREEFRTRPVMAACLGLVLIDIVVRWTAWCPLRIKWTRCRSR